METRHRRRACTGNRRPSAANALMAIGAPSASLAEAGQCWRKHVVPLGPEKRSHTLPCPTACPSAVNQNEGGRGWPILTATRGGHRGGGAAVERRVLRVTRRIATSARGVYHAWSRARPDNSTLVAQCLLATDPSGRTVPRRSSSKRSSRAAGDTHRVDVVRGRAADQPRGTSRGSCRNLLKNKPSPTEDRPLLSRRAQVRVLPGAPTTTLSSPRPSRRDRDT